VVLAASRFILLIFALLLTMSGIARADPITIAFTAMVGSGNSNVIDTDDLFREGYSANLKGQVIVGSVSINPAALTERCISGGACYCDFGAGAVSVSFTLNGITSTVVSTDMPGYFGNSSSGSVLINDKADGSSNYLAVGATTAGGMLQESIGALFNLATVFSAYGGDPAVTVASLNNLGDGTGLVSGGITLMTGDEHLDARILTINVVGVPEPAGWALFGIALIGLTIARRKITA
jgi:PEP-CTERM motif-containing protein